MRGQSTKAKIFWGQNKNIKISEDPSVKKVNKKITIKI